MLEQQIWTRTDNGYYHGSYWITLNVDVHDNQVAFKVLEAEEIASKLIEAVIGINKCRSRCPGCGGVVPELVVEYKGKIFCFTCYEIRSQKTGKVLMETDYKKLGEYLSRKKRRRHSAERVVCASTLKKQPEA